MANNVNASASANGGIGFVGLLTVVLITLKLLGFISWPWIWVLAPLWISFFFGVFIILIVFAIGIWYATKR